MAFSPKTKAFDASIAAVTVGTGEQAMTLGGNKTLPFYSFDAPTENPPKIGVELPDKGLCAFSQPGLLQFYEGCTTLPEMAKRAATLPGVSFLCLHLASADPADENRSVEACTALAKSVSDATQLPLAIMGCGNLEKDRALFCALSEALRGKNVLLLSACEENYQDISTVAALQNGQKIGAESAVDINLAKQLSVLITQTGVAPESVVMNAGSAAAGYGFEYVASTLERIRLAALAQSDDLLQMPVIAPVSTETWSVKEANLPESEMPAWGCAEERGIEMEIATTAACLTSGSDAVILRHPESVKTIAAMIGALV